ncbi:MAG: hypothetical protein LBC97_10460 [Bifidobacteriaceae bacterium]|jgi:hypothetical protein|nr:hypothetical protein [Bifidobacteriaceae bacterium]
MLPAVLPAPASPVTVPRLLRGRMLVLDDHENLCGGPDAPAVVSWAVWEALTSALAVTPEDNVLLGLSDFGAKNFMGSLPVNRVRLRVGRGPDGADNAIIDSVDPQHVAERFDSVVIASGDHIFATLAWRLRDLGMLVCNVTTSAAGVSRALVQACQCHARLRINVRDKGLLERLAASGVPTHGYEGQWIVRNFG